VSVTFTRTREQLRSMVLRKLGVIGGATSVVSADADIVYEAIDLRLKEMHRKGIFWRKVDKVPATFSISAGVSSAHASTNDILFPLHMTVMDGSLDEPLTIIGPIEYSKIELKDNVGIPTKVLWKGSTEFMLHPVPLESSTVKIVYEKIADDTTAGSAADIEVSMIRWMKDIIAYDVGDDFGMDEGRMQRFAKEAEMAEKNIRKLAVERKGFAPVAVDGWPDYQERDDTDYGA
jgi:hypothetical protein